MPRDGSGGYQLPINAWNPATNGVTATPAEWQQLIEDLAAAVAASVSADGQTPITGNIRMGNNQLTGLKAPTGQGQALRWDQLSKGSAIASAGTITIPNEGTLFDVTGTTAITTIDAAFPGRACWLRFADVVTLKKATWLILPGGKDYKTAAGEIVLLINISPTAWQLVTSGGGAGYSFQVGDFLDTLRTLDSMWLRRNGAAYNIADYPVLAPMCEAVPAGVSWAQNTNPISAANQIVIIGQDGLIAAMSVDGLVAKFSTSTDGVTFTEVGSVTFPSGQNPITGFVYGNGKYIVSAYGSFHSTSTDLINWSAPAKARSATVNAYSKVTFGNGIFVMVLRGLSGDANVIMSSSDASIWTQRYSNTGGFDCHEVSFASDIFVVTSQSLASGGVLKTSANGVDWFDRTMGDTSNTMGIAIKHNGVYLVARGSAGGFIYSSNLITWLPQLIDGTFSPFALIGSSIGLLAVGPSGKAYIADNNGLVWYLSDTGSTATLYGAVLLPGTEDKYVVVGPPSYNLLGSRSISPQFRVPNDNPTNGWIRALD